MWFAAAQDCQSSLASEAIGNGTALGRGAVGRRVGGTANVGEGSGICWISVIVAILIEGVVSVIEEANCVFSPRPFKLVESTTMITAMAANATRPAHESPAINRMGLCGLVGAAGKGAGAMAG